MGQVNLSQLCAVQEGVLLIYRNSLTAGPQLYCMDSKAGVKETELIQDGGQIKREKDIYHVRDQNLSFATFPTPLLFHYPLSLRIAWKGTIAWNTFLPFHTILEKISLSIFFCFVPEQGATSRLGEYANSIWLIKGVQLRNEKRLSFTINFPQKNMDISYSNSSH